MRGRNKKEVSFCRLYGTEQLILANCMEWKTVLKTQDVQEVTSETQRDKRWNGGEPTGT